MKAFYKHIIFRMSASNNFIFLSFYRYFYKPGKDTIDGFTNLYSSGRDRVTVVQIGANDGINNDPIHKFIKKDHWQGVLLEPQRSVYEKYLRPLYAKTEGIEVLNAALDTADGQKPIYKIAVSDSRWATGLSSFSREVLEAAIRSGYVERQAIKEGAPLPDKKEDYITEEKVECISTETLIKRNGLEKIDWLQIDTEGFDFEIIKMFNIGITRPEVIVCENLHFTPEQQQDCMNYLEGEGYLCRTFGPNTLAMRKPATGFEEYFSPNAGSH
ncbi:MAG: FkbM family methyltransferase [Bacteroidales bacterium]